MKKIDLITRNIIEVVKESELKKLLKKKKNPSVYCGYETSGPVHIGTMLSLNKLLDFQEAGLKVKILLADFHTWLNMKGSLDWIESSVEYWKHCCKALGLKGEFVLGKDFQMKNEYIKDLLTLSQDTTLNRALRSMQKVARDIEHAHVSQVIYPLMQAVDIKHLDLDIAYGGIEQRKIHMLAREHLETINFKPPVCLHSPLIVSLKGPEVKMSSSEPDSMIMIHDSPEVIKDRIQGAYCTTDDIEGNPVLQIARYLIFPRLEKIKIERLEKFGGDIEYKSYKKLEKDFKKGDLHPADLKSGVSNALIELLKPVRDYFEKKPEARKAMKTVLNKKK
ncbi:MAG: tyrosine--tRNA ligase [Candidatus Undinarchaeales archaeon]